MPREKEQRGRRQEGPVDLSTNCSSRTLRSPTPGPTTPLSSGESAGPYIISGGWWGSGAEVHREYRFVRTGEGPWLWIYYDRKRRGWFLHGKVE